MQPIDWRGMFVPDVSLIEILRGSLIYLGIFVMMRVFPRRQAGTVGISDLLLVTLLADASQNGMAGDYRSIPDGLLLVATIMGWDWLFDWLGYKWKWFANLVEPEPLLLIKDGQMQRQNMKRELVTREELEGLLREHGIEDPGKVRKAYLESDGEFSVIKYEEDESDAKPGKKKTP
jgi:uncharacterized membrane protein YcaP (DUF421 family)